MYKSKFNFKKIKYKFLVSAIFFLIVLSIPIFASSIQELEDQKSVYQNNIDTEKNFINQKQETIDQLEQQLYEQEQIISNLNEEMTVLKSQIETLNINIEQTQKELEDAINREKEQEEKLNERLRVQYMYGSDGMTEILFSGESFTEAIENTEIIADILSADQNLLNELTQLRVSVQEKKDQLIAQRSELDQKTTELNNKIAQQQQIKNDIQKVYDENKDLIEEAKYEIAKEEAAIQAAIDEILAITQEAERQAILQKVEDAKNINSQIQEYSSEIQQVREESQNYIDQSGNESLNSYLEKIDEVVTQSEEYSKQAQEIVSKVEESETAVEAVENSDSLDSLLTAISGNNSSAKDIKADMIADDYEQKKAAQEAEQQIEEARKAAEEANQEAQTALESYQEDAAAEETIDLTSSWENSYVSTTGWRWPLDDVFYITSVFGYRIHPVFGVGRGHEGIDIGASTGTPIHSCDGGTVILAGENGGYGNCVIIQQDSGHQVYYGHQSQIGVSKGQRVEKGDVIGYVGSTGWSTGPHLHLGVLEGGSFIDPFIFFPEVDNS